MGTTISNRKDFCCKLCKLKLLIALNQTVRSFVKHHKFGTTSHGGKTLHVALGSPGAAHAAPQTHLDLVGIFLRRTQFAVKKEGFHSKFL